MCESKSNISECLICLEDVKQKNIVSCGFCQYNGCIKCTRKSVLYQTTDPTCPSCEHGWSYEFCINHLGKTWMKKDYKEHKKHLLFEIEQSKIPNTMPVVERIIKLNNYKKEKEEKEKEITKLGEKMRKLEAEWIAIDNKWQDLKGKKVEKNIVYNQKCPKDNCDGYLNEKYICAMCNAHICKECFEEKKIEEFIGETKSQNGVYKYNHKCNPESIESFKLICKETKPCPNCRTRISKVSGCDQMWCTQCHVTFSWTTGLKVTGNIHNPHYYEWKKNNEEMATFRNVGEILCGGIPDLTYLSNMFRRTETLKGNLEVIMRYNTNHEKMSAFGSFTLDELVNTPNIIYYESSIRHLYIPIFSGDMLPTFKESKNSKQDMFMTSIYESCENSYLKVFYCAVFRQLLFLDNLLKMHRAVSHFENYELHYLRIAVRDIDRKDEELRIKFIMKEIDEKHYKMLIMKKNNKKQKLIKMLHVFEMCYVTILETFNDIVATIYEIIEKHEEYISSYTNNISNLAFESRDDWYNLIYKKWQQHTVVNKKEKILNNYYRLGKIINYCNKELWKISKLYNQNVAFIDYGCQTRDEKFERHGYLNTLSIRWDDPVFQLKKETITKNYKKKVLNVKGKEQDEHFNKCWLFNNNTNDVAYSKYGGIKNDRVIYHYSFIVTVQELLDHSKKEKFRYSGFNKSDMFYLYAKYGAGSSLFA